MEYLDFNIKKNKNNEDHNKNIGFYFYSDITSIIESLNIIKINYSEANDDKFEDLIYNYEIILDKCIKLTKELKLHNSLEIANFFTYMLWNGYFSKSKSFEYKIGKRINLNQLFALDIMNGYGVCTNNSDMLVDLLKKEGYESLLFFNNMKTVKVNYVPKINRKASISRLEKLKIKIKNQKVANHCCALIKDNNKFYIYDPTNLLIFKIDNLQQSSLMNGNGIIKNKLDYSYCCINNLCDKLLFDDFCSKKGYKSPYNSKNFKSYWENNLILFKNNTNLLNDYYDDVKSNIDNIASKIKMMTK